MAWSDVNIARGQNIASLVDTISRRAMAQKELEEKKKARRWQTLGQAAGLGMDLWGTLSGRKFQAGEAEKQRGFEGGESELERGARSDLAQREADLRRELSAADTERERMRIQGELDQLTQKQTWEENVGIPGAIRQAAAGRSQQNIYSGQADQFKLLGDIWQSTVEDNIAQHPEWLKKDPDTGETMGYNLPQGVYDAILRQAELAGVPNEFVQAYLAARQLSETPQGPPPAVDTSQMGGNKNWGGGTPALRSLSPELQNIVQKLQSASQSSKSLQAQQKAQEMISDIQRNPQNYQAGSPGLSNAVLLVDSLIKQYAPTSSMPKYGAFGLK